MEAMVIITKEEYDSLFILKEYCKGLHNPTIQRWIEDTESILSKVEQAMPTKEYNLAL